MIDHDTFKASINNATVDAFEGLGKLNPILVGCLPDGHILPVMLEENKCNQWTAAIQKARFNCPLAALCCEASIDDHGVLYAGQRAGCGKALLVIYYLGPDIEAYAADIIESFGHSIVNSWKQIPDPTAAWMTAPPPGWN